MGGSNSHQFGNHDWQFLRRAGNYDIVKDNRTGVTAEKHILHNNPTMSQEDQMQVYHYRNLTNKPIVKVYDSQYAKGKGGGGACGAAKDIIVHSQYIPHRLSDLKNLNQGQALYILSESLTGFNQLHHRFGPFQITDDHIGFNEIGQAKVWHSPNFATNHLNRDNIVLMSTTNPREFDQRMQRRQQQEMVEDIWMAVSQHANISPQFAQNARGFQGMNFQQAHRLVSDQIYKNNTYVPDYLTFKTNQQGQFVNTTQYGNQGGYPGQNIQYSTVHPVVPAQNVMQNTNLSQQVQYRINNELLRPQPNQQILRQQTAQQQLHGVQSNVVQYKADDNY